MCCVECTRCLGYLLIPLILLGLLTNTLLFFPAMSPLELHRLSDEVLYSGGIIGCGIIMLFPAYSFLRLKKDNKRKGSCNIFGLKYLMLIPPFSLLCWRRGNTKKCCGCDICGVRSRMFISIIAAIIGVVGAAYGMIIAWIAIKKGPKCDVGGDHWEYPFEEWDYLSDKFLWSKCHKPAGIVTWNLTLFSILLGISSAELVICGIQVVNGVLGTVFG